MQQVDLSLLRILQVLLESKKTTEAAKRLNTSQPSISRSLKKLRLLLNDELLIRQNGQIVLTARAQQIQQQLPSLLLQLDNLMAHSQIFHPNQEDLKISIALNSNLAHWFGPRLLKHFFKIAPNIQLTLTDWTSETPQEITDNIVQYGINYFPMDLPKHLIQKKYLGNTLVLICSKDHPLAGKKVRLEHFNQYPLAIHVIQDWNHKEALIDLILAEQNIQPTIKFKSSHLHTILEALTIENLLLPSFKHLATSLPDMFTYLELEDTEIIKTFPEASFGLVYGFQYKNNPILKWIDREVRYLLEEEKRTQQ